MHSMRDYVPVCIIRQFVLIRLIKMTASDVRIHTRKNLLGGHLMYLVSNNEPRQSYLEYKHGHIITKNVAISPVWHQMDKGK